MTKSQYRAKRFEHYRALGEDYGTAHEWSTRDANEVYGRR
jgi:hypothetical protein